MVCSEASNYYDKVIMVDGNHEHHDSNMSVSLGCSVLSKYSDRNKKFVYLSRLHGLKYYKIGSCAFVGTNGWYNFGYDCGHISEQKKAWKKSNDYKKIIFDDEPLEMSKKETKYLSDTIRLLQHDDGITDIVVVTHTLPIETAFGEYANREMPYFLNNGQYINSLMSLVWKLDTHKKIKAWCFGHTHSIRNFTEYGINFLANPRGYKFEGYTDRKIMKIVI